MRSPFYWRRWGRLFKGRPKLLAGENYTLHVEIELNHPLAKEAFLTDVRIAARTRQGSARISEIDWEVKQLIYYYCSEILKSVPSPIRRNILRRNFTFTDSELEKAQRECPTFPPAKDYRS
jgi:hypothetical protein